MACEKLMEELESSLNRQYSIDEKITFLEQLAAANGGKI